MQYFQLELELLEPHLESELLLKLLLELLVVACLLLEILWLLLLHRNALTNSELLTTMSLGHCERHGQLFFGQRT